MIIKQLHGSAILMNPKTGDILAMATYPSYNLNTPFTINIQEDQEKWDEYTAEEKNTKLYTMWGSDRNFYKTYEPGSTFKLFVSAAALEEKITDTDVANDFHCTGSMVVADRTIKCAASAVHGTQTLRDAIKNSCNGAFIQLGQRIGKTTLYKYLRAFGLFEKTGIDITGESNSNFHKIDDVGQVELAVTSFGQRFEITPIQLITAASSIANGGTLVKPKIVRQVYNANTGTTTEIGTTAVRKVISEETANKIKDMMVTAVVGRENVYGNVAGYTVGGKTGTSEPPITRPEEGYAVSYLAIAPADDPEVIGLVVVYNPATSNPYGSRIAAPILSKIFTEVLPYMGIASQNSDTTTVKTLSQGTSVINVKNKTLTEAKKLLENQGFKVVVPESANSNSVLVTEQVPAEGTSVLQGATVVLYTEESSGRTSVQVPNLVGMTLTEAKSALSERNLNLSYSGSGKVVSQSIRRRRKHRAGNYNYIKIGIIKGYKIHMEYIDIKSKQYLKEDIEKAAKIIRSSGCIVVPTDTVYGIATSALDEDAVKKIYNLKQRKFTKPINILVSNFEMIKNSVKNISLEEEKIIKKFFPGALTIVFEKNEKIPGIVTAGLSTVGVRMPKNKFLLELIEFIRSSTCDNKL